MLLSFFSYYTKPLPSPAHAKPAQESLVESTHLQISDYDGPSARPQIDALHTFEDTVCIGCVAKSHFSPDKASHIGLRRGRDCQRLKQSFENFIRKSNGSALAYVFVENAPSACFIQLNLGYLDVSML